MGSEHVSRIKGDSGVAEASHESIEIHVNDAVVPVLLELSHLFVVALLPSLIIVGPWALIAVRTMRVSDFDNLGASLVLEHDYTNHSVRVALIKTVFVFVFITASRCATCDDVAMSISFGELLPDLVFAEFREGFDHFVGGAINLIYTHSCVA